MAERRGRGKQTYYGGSIPPVTAWIFTYGQLFEEGGVSTLSSVFKTYSFLLHVFLMFLFVFLVPFFVRVVIPWLYDQKNHEGHKGRHEEHEESLRHIVCFIYETIVPYTALSDTGIFFSLFNTRYATIALPNIRNAPNKNGAPEKCMGAFTCVK